MANAWAEVFIQGKWLNSTNDIIVLKCPNQWERCLFYIYI